jgi:hypothetical protein
MLPCEGTGSFGGRLKLKGGSQGLPFSEGKRGFYATNDEDDGSDVCRQGTTGKQMRSKRKERPRPNLQERLLRCHGAWH